MTPKKSVSKSKLSTLPLRSVLKAKALLGLASISILGCNSQIIPVGTKDGKALIHFAVSGPSSVPTSTCIEFTIQALGSDGNPTAVSGTIPISLLGLGSGEAFGSETDCDVSQQSTATVYLNPGASEVRFFYRTQVSESLNISIQANQGAASASKTVAANTFDVIGQPASNARIQFSQGVSAPVASYTDGTRLYVVDNGSNRVLGWNSIPTSTGQKPDFVLGQPNFTSTSANTGGVSASSMSYPYDVTGDGTRLFVSDYNNSRVLVWNSMPTTTGQPADFVLGQPNATSNTPNNGGISASRMMSPGGLATDGTRLYVSDMGNHRVLMWTTLPNSNGQAANRVLGQANFTANTGGVSSTAMSYPAGLATDGTYLFLADYGNSRVLIWNSIPTSNGQAANVALGQTLFTTNGTNSGGISNSSLKNPRAVATDGTRLFVADYGNSRVLKWNSIPSSMKQAADVVIGQPNFTSNTAGLSASLFSSVTGVFLRGSQLFVADQGNSRILIWNTLPTSNGTAANLALGQPTLTSNGAYNVGVTAAYLNRPASARSDKKRAVVADTGNNRVLLWNTLPSADGSSASIALGQPDLTSKTAPSSTTALTLSAPSDAMSDGTRLFVVDQMANRVLIWNSIPTASGQAADVVLGQPNMTSSTGNNGGVSASSLYMPNSVYSDGTRLFVADLANSRVLIWNAIPTTNGKAADVVLGQPNMTSNAMNNGGLSSSSLLYAASVHSDGTRLFVVDAYNHRVLIWNTIPTTNGKAADVVVGQPNFSSNTANNGGLSASALNTPFSVNSDGIRLLVCDGGNHRILVWNTIPASNGQPADRVIGQPNATSNSANNGGITSNSLNTPKSVYSTGSSAWIADNMNDRILVVPLH